MITEENLNIFLLFAYEQQLILESHHQQELRETLSVGNFAYLARHYPLFPEV